MREVQFIVANLPVHNLQNSVSSSHPWIRVLLENSYKSNRARI